MTYKNLQDEVLSLRFNETYRASVKSWLNLRYAALWAREDWHFKHVRDAALALTGADTTPTMPSDFAKAEQLIDDLGSPLRYLEPDRFRATFTNATATGRPAYYTVVDREIVLGPIPDAAYSFKLSYLRRLSHVDGASGLVAAGVMSADADQPLWEAEYDYLLVLDACILGQQATQDPNWQDFLPQRDELLAAMRDDLVGGVEGEVVQWGTSDW